MLLQKVNSQFLREYLGILGLVRCICRLTVVQSIRIVGLKLLSSVLDDAPVSYTQLDVYKRQAFRRDFSTMSSSFALEWTPWVRGPNAILS